MPPGLKASMTATTFKEIFVPMGASMYRTAFAMVGNAQDAEDLVQEAFVRLWQARERLPREGRLEAYCTTLTRNVCTDYLRRRRPAESHLPADDTLATDERQASADIETTETIAEVEAAIEALPEHQREVVGMSVVEGLSPQEIEQATGYSSVNVRVLLSRGKQKLNRILQR